LISRGVGTELADDVTKAARAIHTAHDNGITLFDHTDASVLETTETVFGTILKHSPGLRRSIIIQSKCGQVWAETRRTGEPILPDLSLDILLLSMPDSLAEPDEIAQSFEELYSSGKVRHFGVCDHNAAQIQLLKKSVRQPIIFNQIQLGLAHAFPLIDGMEFALQIGKGLDGDGVYTGIAGAGTIDYCRANDIQIQARSPLHLVLNPPSDATPQRAQTATLLADLASAKGTTPSAVALAWLLRHPARIVPIIGSLEPMKIIESCRADRVDLSREEWYRLFIVTSELTPLQH
jgi:predicted oxidoreductase